MKVAKRVLKQHQIKEVDAVLQVVEEAQLEKRQGFTARAEEVVTRIEPMLVGLGYDPKVAWTVMAEISDFGLES